VYQRGKSYNAATKLLVSTRIKRISGDDIGAVNVSQVSRVAGLRARNNRSESLFVFFGNLWATSSFLFSSHSPKRLDTIPESSRNFSHLKLSEHQQIQP
jgi:hypothetical protein